jgi:NAD(P)H-flavin reductase
MTHQHNIRLGDNAYLPKVGRIAAIKDEVAGARAIKTFSVDFPNNDGFAHECGQCAMLSIFGKGEVMISIASPPLVTTHKEFSIMKVGKVTTALHDLKVGDMISVRGPYGNTFPINDWKGRNLVFIGGGVGLAPIWPVLRTAIANRADYGKIDVFYGARRSQDLMYFDDLNAMHDRAGVHLSIDAPEEGWSEYVGFVPSNVREKAPSPDNTIAIVCGPPIMIKFVMDVLLKSGFKDEQIYTTIENKMKCGIGKCGRCNVGKDYVCVSGPVYSWAQLKDLPQEY